MRTITYTYDGLQRLIGAQESPGSSYGYQYDVAGNRTQVTVNGTTTQQYSYDAANQVQGWTYDQRRATCAATAPAPTATMPWAG